MSPSVLTAGVARATVNPPLTLEQGVWGAKAHVTPRGLESDFWVTCLVLSEGPVTSVLLDLDLCTIPNSRADRIRDDVAAALGIRREAVRVSVTHTHAGPVLRADHYTVNPGGDENYITYLREHCVGTALQAARERVPVRVSANQGHCTMARSRRQRLEDGLVVAGYDPEGTADPTVSVVRFDDLDGRLVASIVHYAAHPTTLGYTNDLLSPDYPGVTKRFVEATVGGTCLFLQGAAGDVGPGPGGFLSNLDVVHSIGTQLGCAASQALLEAGEQRFDYAFSTVVRSGADLGVWSRTTRPVPETPLLVASVPVPLPLQEQPPPAMVQQRSEELFALLEELRRTGAPEDEVHDVAFRLRRSNMALQRSREFHGRATYDLEVHLTVIGDVVLIGLPVEPFCEIGMAVRARSPFRHTLLSGYSNGANGYLPTPAAAAVGGYEVDQMAFAHHSADLLTERVLELLDELAAH
ncbi:hypothetical protein GC722_06665 [Auraticoccus sp. F435]|uniref:Neutral/alkaline non-lysosomal ceramidase N-terminal domain-containing protein n=1 Tax=Auraticoccus cholistanensis TaxID=2656650 RepID=A0A6A9US14_9ACTN|nr:neutral/alkaline non-lysosomal ceramidase N-terminal domain-containing protein [Auraticoccus cholistanensis]MVA75706.1 hypothetical protein [Auraticoccus cholistanensis]